VRLTSNVGHTGQQRGHSRQSEEPPSTDQSHSVNKHTHTHIHMQPGMMTNRNYSTNITISNLLINVTNDNQA